MKSQVSAMSLETINIYWLMIGLSLVVILSYTFNYISMMTRVPSVVLLIFTGYIVSIFLPIDSLNLKPFLQFLGAVGLIMIVLEASLDLELKKEKRKLMIKAILIALFLLILNSIIVGVLILWVFKVPMVQALFYAIPLSIMSSAIIIPSVGHLNEHKKEFLIFEAAFSDIFGIMFFYFLEDSLNIETSSEIVVSILTNVGVTAIISLVLGYLIILLVQKVKAQVKLFLPIAVLILLYSVGKLFHLSSLIFILFFGLMINNRDMFFKGTLLKLVKKSNFNATLEDLKMLTLETSFLVRTFFFIVFGMSITAHGMDDPMVYFVGFLTVIIFFVGRWGLFNIAMKKDKNPALWIAPRGLITILLYFAIPESMIIEGFHPAILLLVILLTNLLMTYGLMKFTPKTGLDEINGTDEINETNIFEEESSVSELDNIEDSDE